MTTMTLTEFLLARIAEDEAVAKRGPYPEPPWWRLENVETDESMFIAIDPARLLAECEAKRQIVEYHTELMHGPNSHSGVCSKCTDENHQDDLLPWPCFNLGALALPYRDHPEFNPDWALRHARRTRGSTRQLTPSCILR